MVVIVGARVDGVLGARRSRTGVGGRAFRRSWSKVPLGVRDRRLWIGVTGRS